MSNDDALEADNFDQKIPRIAGTTCWSNNKKPKLHKHNKVDENGNN